METLKKLWDITPSQQLYIVIYQLSRIFGWETPINDRKLPFEKLIQLIATLPKSISDSYSSKVVTRFWNDLEHPTRYWPAHSFRSADGSNNSHIYPHMGASNTSYARSVISTFGIRSELPKPEDLFDDLMKRPEGTFEPHPTGINSLLFCFAGIITHDLFRSDPANPTINQTTHYADLSVLYGVNQEEQNGIRRGQKNGLILPDTFADPRLQFQLPGIVALLILFSRNHNYIARNLLKDTVNKNQEDCRFTHVDGKDSVELSEKRTDELVFQTARLINCACYANLILNEYIRTILGISTDSEFTLNPLMTPPLPNPTSGNVISLEFGYVYRWHGALSEASVKWLKDFPIVEKYMELKKDAQRTSEEDRMKYEHMTDDEKDAYKKTMKKEEHQKLLDILTHFGYTKEEISLGPMCLGHHRDIKTKGFNSIEIIQVLQENIESVAGKMGAQKIPASLKAVEIQGIRAARKVGLCTLNEFRRFFHLEEYKSYEEMLTGSGQNPDRHVVDALKKHYGPNGIDRVELYPGIVIEATKNDGLSLPYTTARAILSDAVNLLRNDRFYTDGLNSHDLTLWGYNYVNSPDGTAQVSIFKKMVENAFPEWADVIGVKKANKLLLSPFKIHDVKIE